MDKKLLRSPSGVSPAARDNAKESFNPGTKVFSEYTTGTGKHVLIQSRSLLPCESLETNVSIFFPVSSITAFLMLNFIFFLFSSIHSENILLISSARVRAVCRSENGIGQT